MSTNEKSTPENLIAQALSVEALIGYQTGSVVSRTILHKNAGTVTLFAFDAGEELSEHKTPYDAMVYIVEGEAEITIAGAVNKVKQGEMIIMPADTPHGLKALSKYKMMLIMIQS